MKQFAPAFSKHNFEDKLTLKQIEKIFVHKRGFTFQIPTAKEPVVLMLSGGMDSIALWHLLLSKYQLHVYPLHLYSKISYRRQQIASINYFSRWLRQRYPSLFHAPKFQPVNLMFRYNQNNLHTLMKDLPMLTANMINQSDRDQHKFLINSNPARLGFFAFSAYEYALALKVQGIKVHTILNAIVLDDTRISRESTLTVLRSLNLAFCLILGDWRWQFSAPIEVKKHFAFNKLALCRFVLKQAMPLERTWSCDRYFPWQCGTCPSCLSRKEIFQALNIKDRAYLVSSWWLRLKLRLNLKNRFFRQLEKLTKPPVLAKTYCLTELKRYRFAIAPAIKWHLAGDQVFVLHEEQGTLIELNQAAVPLWRAMAANLIVTFPQLLNILHKESGVKRTKLELDLVAFINRFLKDGYLVIC